jgi:non-ribosomal peptide synthetase-like protein
MTSASDTALSILHGEARAELIRDEALADIFRATAGRLPDKVAVTLIGGVERLTYRELDRRSDLVAAALVSRGIGPGTFVGLWFRRSVDLHVGLLGIVKSGAAFIPFDADVPADRVASSLSDCGAPLLLTHDAMRDKTAGVGVETLLLETCLGAPVTAPAPVAARPDQPAYAIYTSGTTGKPKGIVITQRNVCHYLRSGNLVLGMRESDVVLQQASIAFDLSIEEIFVPYLVGATLAVATLETLRQADRLADMLEVEGITVIDTVPTLLSMLERDVPGVRLIIVGGEACPPALVERLARPGRLIVNTYGPTETTIVATAAVLVPGEPVTIGKPIANYTAYVVDEETRLLAPGATGELLVGGPGVARGYLNQPELTAQKFIPNPFSGPGAADPVLYRTGDAVSLDEVGRIRFHGRIDTQVKIRGFRIELGEIEALIAGEPGVQTAAVTVAQHGAAGDTLVAHVVAKSGESFDPAAAKSALAAKLPPYMVPAHWRQHEDLPRLSSGKIDRRSLGEMPLLLPAASGEQEPPRSQTEAQLLKAARDVFGVPVLDFEADFFGDLGGNSLIAARFVSEVRRIPHLSGVALQDVYTQKTLRRLANVLDERAKADPVGRSDLSFEPVPLRRRFLCGLAQAAALPFIIAVVTTQWIGLLLSSIYLVRDGTPWWQEIILLCLIYMGLNLGTKVMVVILKWVVIGRTKPGVYPLWGSYYFRIWIMQRVVHLTAHKFLQGTPLMRIYLRALGARIGKDAIINEFEDGAIDLVSIGERSSLGSKVKLANVEVIGNQVFVGVIDVGNDVSIGNGCVIGYDTHIGHGAEVGDLTCIPPGCTVAAGDKWDGAPPRRVGKADTSSLPPHPEISGLRRGLQTLGYFVTYNLIMMVGLLPIFPAFYVLSYIDDKAFGDGDKVLPWEWVFFLAWPAALVLVFVSMAIVVGLRWTLMPSRVQPGRFSIFSGFYFRKWTMTLATETMLETLNSLYATVFMRNWYRLMGTKVGKGTEISSNFAGRYDLIELGANNFLGDEAIFGDEDVRQGWMVMDRVRTGDRCFFGNLSVIPKGSVIDDDALIGVKTRMPESLHVKSGETWFGSPAMPMPNRQKIAQTDLATYQPAHRMRLLRTGFEALHTSFPTAVLISLAYITADLMEYPMDAGNYGTAFAMFMVAGVITSLIMCLVSVLVKWSMMGIYRPVMKPMWSWWAMRTEAVAVLYGGLSSKVLLDYLRGTPFLPWMLRLYGTKIGKGVWLNSADLTEFDCVTIGDHAVINMQSSPQTHLYEDRVMKVGRIEIGKGVTVGTATIILYDSTIGDYAQLGPLTVVMKGEFIPPHTIWIGAPARRGSAQDAARGLMASDGKQADAKVSQLVA